MSKTLDILTSPRDEPPSRKLHPVTVGADDDFLLYRAGACTVLPAALILAADRVLRCATALRLPLDLWRSTGVVKSSWCARLGASFGCGDTAWEALAKLAEVLPQ